LAALETTIVAEGWNGTVTVRSAIDGSVTNAGVERYAALGTVHLEVLETGPAPGSGEVIEVVAQTNQSKVRVAVAARTRLSIDDQPLAVTPVIEVADGVVAQEFTLDLVAGRPVT